MLRKIINNKLFILIVGTDIFLLWGSQTQFIRTNYPYVAPVSAFLLFISLSVLLIFIVSVIISGIINSIIRPFQMKALAYKYGLSYNWNNRLIYRPISEMGRRNKIEGEIDGIPIKIWDNLWASSLGNFLVPSSTTINIEGRYKTCTSKFFSLCSIKKIEKYIQEIHTK